MLWAWVLQSVDAVLMILDAAYAHALRMLSGVRV